MPVGGGPRLFSGGAYDLCGKLWTRAPLGMVQQEAGAKMPGDLAVTGNRHGVPQHRSPLQPEAPTPRSAVSGSRPNEQPLGSSQRAICMTKAHSGKALRGLGESSLVSQAAAG